MEDRSFLSILTCAHGEHFWAPSTSPQNWGHLSWWGQSKWPHSNLGRCRCVLFGTGSHTAIPSANKAYLDALSSATKLVTQIGNHTQTVWPSFARFSTWVPRFEITRRCVKLMFTVCVALWKSAATAHFCARRTFLTIATCGNGSVPDSTG